MTQIRQDIIDLYDAFTHGVMDRRAFFEKLTVLAGGAAAATALLSTLKSDYAEAATVAEDDPRITTSTISVPGVTGLSGYLAKPVGAGRHPTVLVIHENRGLTPHIKDVTRRVATAGYIALGLDFLSPVGGTPANEDQAREMIGKLKPEDATASGIAALKALDLRRDGNGKVGAVGFCWGGGMVNRLAISTPILDAGVAYYGVQPPADQVPKIKAAMMAHYGGLDTRINAGIPAYEAALKAAGTTYQLWTYEGANHAFNNDTAGPRYDRAAADLAWGRTLNWFAMYLN